MIQGFAEQIGGTFRIKSTAGQGTTAELWLQVAEAGLAGDRAAAREETLTDVKPLSILAVDDDPLVLMNTSAMLEDLGHTVVEANSGIEGLAKFREHPHVDLVITDQAMPGMSGLEMARSIRADRPEIPIIIATGYGEFPDEPELSVARLPKPFGPGNLADAVIKAIHSSER
jgi:CheY-like chemotaxis protein